MDRFNKDHYLDKKFRLMDMEDINKHVNNSAYLAFCNILTLNGIPYHVLNENKKSISFHDGLNIVLVNHSMQGENTLRFSVNKDAKIIWIELNNAGSSIYNNYDVEIQSNTEFIKLYLGSRVNANIKNNFNFLLRGGKQLHYKAFSFVSAGHVVDDAIECLHLEDGAKSILEYYSFVLGKVVTQVNTIIRQQASNNESHQILKHLLLKNSAQCFSKPNLQIENNQVIASHGNAISALNNHDLFYLMQRGLSIDDCCNVLQYSRLAEVVGEDFIYKLILGVISE